MFEFAMPLSVHAGARARPLAEAGFTLVELAIVMMIIGLLMSSLIVPLSAQVDQRNNNETKQQISEIREALLGFAVTNGRLPSPATSAVDGAENPVVCANNAACTGFIPWATLGVKKTDAWNKMIRYSVTPTYAAAAPFSLTTNGNKKVQTRDDAGIISYLLGSAGGCDSCAPAIIYAAGKNNWGFNAEGVALPDGSTTNVDEDTNAAATTVFVSRNPSTVPDGGEFDDIVVWIPRYVLMNRMVAAGKLP